MVQPVGRRALPADDEADEQVSPGSPRRGFPAEEPAAAERPRRGADPDPDDRPRRGWPKLVALGVVLAVGIGLAYLLLPRPAATPTLSATPGVSATPDPSPTPSPTAAPLRLDDALIIVPDGWEVYADETVQDDRRLVRLRDPEAGLRLQAVTLTSVSGSLATSCSQLLDEQLASYADAALTPPFTVPVAPGGEGYSCGFNNLSTDADEAVNVTFTLLRRDADDHALVLRTTTPRTLAESAQARQQLEALTCTAATSFEVDLTRCH